MAEKETVLTKTYDLLLYLIPVLTKFPRNHKFLLGDRIENTVLDVLEDTTSFRHSVAECIP